jgi:hypothetical protein
MSRERVLSLQNDVAALVKIPVAAAESQGHTSVYPSPLSLEEQWGWRCPDNPCPTFPANRNCARPIVTIMIIAGGVLIFSWFDVYLIFIPFYALFMLILCMLLSAFGAF